ncbi:MAG: hypothetical protein V1748_07570 [Actinomycetota bacterium]
MEQVAYPHPDPDRGRTVALVAVITGVLVLLVVPVVLLFAGAIRFGRPGAGKVQTAASVDSGLKPVEAASRFGPDDERIYCCAVVRAYQDTVVGTQWRRGAAMVASMSGRFGDLARGSATKFLLSSGRVAFYLQKPAGGWQPGSYTVGLSIDGKAAGETSFAVSGDGASSRGTTYRDPSGRFTVEVPTGWIEMDQRSTGGALAGFMAPASGYAPRFVVVSTPMTSATPESLNAALAAEGVPEQERFTAITLGTLVGARRTYEWDLEENGGKTRLKSIQVVVDMGNGTVLEINCHSQATRFDENLPTFNSVINSFH